MLKQILTFSLVLAAILLPAKVLKKDNYAKNPTGGWLTQPYWGGARASVTDGKAKCLQLTATAKGSRIFGRLLGHASQTTFVSGTQLKINLTVKGTGKFKAGVIIYDFAKGKQPQYIYAKTIDLNDKFTAYSATITLPRRLRQVLPVLDVEGKDSKAVIKSYQLVSVEPTAKIQIAAVNQLQLVTALADIKPVIFKTNLPNQEFSVCQRDNTMAVDKKVESDAGGMVRIVPEAKGSGLIEISIAAKGNYGMAYICLENAADFKRTDAIAKQVKLPKKLHALFIADSLTDFYRGYNYVDRLMLWLNRYNPGKFTVRNAAVRGDYTTRVLQRMQGRKSTFEFRMYKDLFKEKYDIIFINLGHNDTRCRRSQKFSKPFIPPAQQEKELRDIIKIIRANSAARIVFISPSPSYVKTFEENHRRLPKSREIYMYGKKEFVDAFDATNRKLCKEFNFDYIDILSVMRANSDLKSLYQPDAVHLSVKGGRVVADELLKYFAK